MTRWPLTRRGPAGGLHAFKLIVHGDRREPPAELPVHEGNEWLYVLSGRLRLLLGDDDLVIEPGERSSSRPGRPTGSAPSTARSS